MSPTDYLVLGNVNNFPCPRTYYPQRKRGEALISNGHNPICDDGPYSTSENVHQGQRKLLMSEIHFLTEVYSSMPRPTSILCVYAGACPCTHLDRLAIMFPNVYFMLVDPMFSKTDTLHLDREIPRGRVTVCKEWFTDDTVHAIKMWMKGVHMDHWVHRKLRYVDFDHKQLTGTNLLFISDIRSDPYDDKSIAHDMWSQAKWFRDIGAEAGLLKFRLPFVTDDPLSRMPVNTLKGDVCVPIWGPPSTTECRLLVYSGCGDHKYDPVEHERTMAGFNGTERKKQYTYNGICYHSVDEFAEAVVVDKYYQRFAHPPLSRKKRRR
jgi:cap2 methyltransferase